MTGKHTILVIDDEPDVVKSVRDLLRLEYNVVGLTSARDAIQALQSEEIHVIMTDQRMPEMSGVELLTRLRVEYPDAIRIIFTGYSDIHAVIEAINQGNVYRYVVKPWNPEELQTVIRDACHQYDLIVERKRLLDELRAKNQELAAANEELHRTDQLKNAFLQVASHELRTPLSIVLMLAKLGMQKPRVATEESDCLRRIEQAGRRLEYLIRQMDSVLSSRQASPNLSVQTVDLHTLLREAAENIRPFVAMRRQTLHWDVPDDLGMLEVDPVKIEDALEQLLMNAVKFTPDVGRITLQARAGSNGGGAEIRVGDTGVGIAPEHLPHLFEPLFTGLDTLHHSSGLFEFGRKGLGLGLCTVKSFIEMHGGSIAVDSHVGRGTTFTITLPRKQAIAGTGTAASAPAPRSEVS